ncbi:hypothetical protein H8356DRAFT_1388423, partial [Neocallimastix lanati (nom. inval.)]
MVNYRYLNNYRDNNINNIFLRRICNLLNCKLVLNGNEVEFENGKLITTTEIVNNDVDIKILKELIEAETKEIREMIVLPLTLNANLSTLGYIMDNSMIQTMTISYLSKFPGETIDPSSIYLYYSQWLHYLDHSPDYDKKSLIPK